MNFVLKRHCLAAITLRFQIRTIASPSLRRTAPLGQSARRHRARRLMRAYPRPRVSADSDGSLTFHASWNASRPQITQ